MPPANASAVEGLRRWWAGTTLPAPADEATADAWVDEALRQGVAAGLHAQVKHDPAWPASSRRRLAAAVMGLLKRGVHQLELAERVRGGLETYGLRALPLKGAALAEWLYASPAERPMADVDLLVLDDPHAAGEVLRGWGFEPAEQADHAAAWREPGSGLCVELHSALASCPGLHPLHPGAWWARSRPCEGQLRRRPAPADLLAQLALHAAFQHGLVLALVQWEDLGRLGEYVRLHEPELLQRPFEPAGTAWALQCAWRVARAVRGGAEPPACASRRLPPALERRVASLERHPQRALVPARPALARLRWALATGRRRRLLSESLRPAGRPGAGRPGWDAAIVRAGRLAWRRWRPATR